ncbi:MAG: GNAT family N-acetyltransferase, partial [Eubacteriales bacterium]|nr:GNAT family N-acetyltransferase [Eubacteriales bacterium]
MEYSLVTAEQLSEVFALYQAAIDDMHARNLFQWDWGEYPSEGLLREDVEQKRLYRLDAEGRLAAVFAVCVGQGPEYDDVPWQFGVNPVCLHRIALHPECNGKGYARDIMAFVKQQGKKLGCDCLRVDTYAQNQKALRLFSETTVREAGTFRFEFRPDEFHCFESPLTEDCPLLPVRMHPAYRYGALTPWGGDALKRIFGKDIPDPRTGEALEISCIPGLESTDDMGETLPALIARSGEALVGENNANPFPLLLKLLAADDNLSVQVHPNDDYALKNEGKLGKTEAWVILNAEPGAQLCYGLKDGVTTGELANALLTGGDVETLLAYVDVKAGDVLYMPSGMVHAIGGGVTLYEIQQSSDVTYRLWDYHRKDAQGNERPLHVRQALDVVDPALRGLRTRLPETEKAGEHVVLSVPAFTL